MCPEINILAGGSRVIYCSAAVQVFLVHVLYRQVTSTGICWLSLLSYCGSASQRTFMPFIGRVLQALSPYPQHWNRTTRWPPQPLPRLQL